MGTRAVLTALWLGVAACADGVDPPDMVHHPDDLDDAGPSTSMMVQVPSGPFMMGCNSAVVGDCDVDESPYHSVVLSTYEIDRTEVTQSSYANCLAAGACSEPSANWDPIDRGQHPVTNISWTQASEFCAWTGRRLPTEAEWEKAARGGEGRLYPWGSASPDCTLANVMGCDGMPSPADTHRPGVSPYGVLDMAGNVVEWVADWYAPDAYATSIATGASVDPQGPTSGVLKVLRGGSWLSNDASVRASFRSEFLPSIGEDTFGFRCARSVYTAPGTD